MRELIKNIIDSIKRKKFYSLLKKESEKELKAKENQRSKAEMCKKTITAGLCPNACEICAWNSKR